MKTLIAALAISVATAGSAFALDANQRGVGASLQDRGVFQTTTVSGFTGNVSGDYDAHLDANQRGVPVSISDVNEGDIIVAGFTGIESGDMKNSVDGNQKGLPASLR